jgi:hypothetical protein
VAAALDPSSPFAHAYAGLLRAVVTDRRQLAQLDHLLALAVAAGAGERPGVRAFREAPPVSCAPGGCLAGDARNRWRTAERPRALVCVGRRCGPERRPPARAALLAGRFAVYARYRLGGFAATRALGILVHLAELISSGPCSPPVCSRAPVVVVNLCVLLGSFWWGALETLRARLRDAGRARDRGRGSYGAWLAAALLLAASWSRRRSRSPPASSPPAAVSASPGCTRWSASSASPPTSWCARSIPASPR